MGDLEWSKKNQQERIELSGKNAVEYDADRMRAHSDEPRIRLPEVGKDGVLEILSDGAYVQRFPAGYMKVFPSTKAHPEGRRITSDAKDNWGYLEGKRRERDNSPPAKAANSAAERSRLELFLVIAILLGGIFYAVYKCCQRKEDKRRVIPSSV